MSLTRSSIRSEGDNTLDSRDEFLHGAIAVLSAGFRPLGSCPRAAGWNAATLCRDPKATSIPRIATPQNALTVHFSPDCLKPIPCGLPSISSTFARH
jgi:hypothetical protein